MFLIGFHLKHDCKFPRVGMAQPKFTFPYWTLIKDYAVDKLAEALLGSEFPGVVPLAVQGDGNCLLRFCCVRMHMYVCMYVCMYAYHNAVLECPTRCSWCPANFKMVGHNVRQSVKSYFVHCACLWRSLLELLCLSLQDDRHETLLLCSRWRIHSLE